jgi:hypothetical protein
VSNVHKKKKQYREAEEVLLRGTAATLGASDPHEHPFWYAALSLPSSPCSAGVGLRPLCRLFVALKVLSTIAPASTRMTGGGCVYASHLVAHVIGRALLTRVSAGL